MSRFIGLKTPDRYLYLYDQVNILRSIKEINNIKKDFSESERLKLKKALKTFMKVSMRCSYYTSLLEKDSKTIKERAERLLQRETKKFPVIIQQLMKAMVGVIS